LHRTNFPRSLPCKVGGAAACVIGCMPGSNERALEKAKILPADALILDLEEALAPDAKQLARDRVCAAVKGGAYGAREIIIRVNALETPGEPRTCSLFAMRRVTRFWCRR
jgi:citrate lyase beta subunit